MVPYSWFNGYSIGLIDFCDIYTSNDSIMITLPAGKSEKNGHISNEYATFWLITHCLIYNWNMDEWILRNHKIVQWKPISILK